MKTLKKFESESAKVILRMHDINEKTQALYSVQETPKRKTSKWKESTKYFDFSDEAAKYFIELVIFWCN